MTTKRTVNQLVAPRRGGKRLPTAEPRGAIVSGRGVGKPSAAPSAAGGGIQSPCKELDGSRQSHGTIHEERSPDGWLVREYYALKEIRFRDGRNATAVFEFLDLA